jgi:hypothetical protein
VKTISIRKKVAAVAVASLGFGVLTSISPANATAPNATVPTFIAAGSTTAVAGSDSAADTVYVRSTSATNTFVFTLPGSETTANNDTVEYTLSTSSTAAGITAANSVVITGVTDGGSTNVTPSVADAIDANSTDDNTLAKILFTADITATTTISISTGALTAGTYYLWADTDAADVATGDGVLAATITSYDVGAPATASYSAVGYTQIGSPANVNSTISLKDASGRSTFLIGDETIAHSETPVTNATAPAVTGLEGSADTTAGSTPSNTAGVFAGYTVAILGAGTGTPTKGVLYTITSTIRNGAVAFGSASVTYRNVDTTASIAGGSITFTDATTKAVVTSIPTATSLQSTAADYVITVKDAAGALVKGAVPVATASTGTVSAAVGTTVDAGTDSSFRFTAPSTAGSSTVTFSLSTGATSMSTSVTFVATAFGATEAVADTAVKSVVKNDGSGIVMTSTAPTTNAWSASRNVTSISATIGGLDAAKAAKLAIGGTNGASNTRTINAVAGPVYPVASSTGEITFRLGVSATPNNNDTITVTVDQDGGGSPVTVLTITFADAANSLTTSPAASSLNMSTPSATKAISATVADQYGNPVTGGSFRLTNTVVPAGATAATVVNVNADASGKATLNAVLGATLGTYTFTVEALSANASAIGSTSTINYSVTTTGIAGSLTLTDNDSVTATELTSDNKGSRTVVVSANNVVSANVAVGGALTDSASAITVTSATPAALAFTATATNGIRLFTTSPNGSAIAIGKSEVTGTAGSSANLWAVPTKVGAGTITVVSGGLTVVYTLTGTIAAGAKTAFVTLTPTTTIGQYTVKATDLFGNGVVSDVAISLTGPGSFSNGFKNLTVTTGADGTNTFNVVSDGSAATTIKAVLAAGTYQVITAANAKTAGIVGLGTDGATTDTATATMSGKGGTSELNSIMTSIAALNARIVALNALIAKIMKRLNIR